MINELALFAGVCGGGLATKYLLGARTICYVENGEYPVKVLRARIRDGLLDDAPVWGDVGTFDGRPWRGCVDLLTAGFPCQPFAPGGLRLGADDPRNRWPDTIRIIGEVRPDWVFLENSPQLLYVQKEGKPLHTYERLSASWPSWGMWVDGAVYRLPTLASSTNGDVCGLLPTPVARDGDSFYVVTRETSQRIMKKTGSVGRQLHWMQYGVVYHDLKKGWANPRFSEMLMGWPIGWTDLQPLEPGRFRMWLDEHGIC